MITVDSKNVSLSFLEPKTWYGNDSSIIYIDQFNFKRSTTSDFIVVKNMPAVVGSVREKKLSNVMNSNLEAIQ